MEFPTWLGEIPPPAVTSVPVTRATGSVSMTREIFAASLANAGGLAGGALRRTIVRPRLGQVTRDRGPATRPGAVPGTKGQDTMKFGVGLGRAHPAIWGDVTERADALGYESVWVAEHLVLPVEMAGSPIPGDEHPPIPPNTPVYDAWVFLAYLAGRSKNINLGTNVYNLALRHPFVAARSIATLDVISGGRALAGLGASWLQSEWDAVGQDFHTRGKRMDEALEICIRLWTEERIAHHGRFYDFDPVMFEPKPVQKPHPPILIGGESDAALRRAARVGSGWIALGGHSLEEMQAFAGKLRAFRLEYGRSDAVEITGGGPIETQADVERWAEAGVDRVIVSPWQRSRDALAGLERFAEQVMR